MTHGGSQVMSNNRSDGEAQAPAMHRLKTSVWWRGPTDQPWRSNNRWPKQRRLRTTLARSTVADSMHSSTMSTEGALSLDTPPMSKSCVIFDITFLAISPSSCDALSGNDKTSHVLAFCIPATPEIDPEPGALLAMGDCDRMRDVRSMTVRLADSAVFQSCLSTSRALSRMAIMVSAATSCASLTLLITEMPVPAKFDTQSGIGPAPSFERKASQKWQQFRDNKS
mmetsp:Transcript_84061/g.243001  ORF Transcript_84061/g.243001 Transcript_84061/m.243001 type:complete len:225 (-) Transcript_84061:321-995(-)